MKTKFLPAVKGLDRVTTKLDPSDIINGTPNSVAGFDSLGALESIPGWNIDTTSGGLNELITWQPNGINQNTTLNVLNFNSDPLQNSPNESQLAQYIGMSLDVNNNGFSLGVGGTAAGLLSLNMIHQGSGDVGFTYASSANYTFGNGTDPFTMQGWAYALGFGTVNANVTIDGQFQGYTFQPNVSASAVSTSNFSCSPFVDSANIGIAVHGYTPFSSTPIIASIANNSGFTGFNINPTIPLFSGNAGFNGIAISGNLGTLGTSGFQGININPTISAAGSNTATGLNISMFGVTGTNVKAINTSDGQVNIGNNNLKLGQPGFTSNSSIDTSTSGAFGGVFGNNQIGGSLSIAAGFPINGDFGFGNNLGITVSAQDDMFPDGSGLGLGFSMNGFVTAIAAATGKTFDTLNFMAAGASIAGAGGDNGVFTNVNMFRALGIVAGTGGATITNQIGFNVDSFFSSTSPTNAWGFYCADTNADNWFAKNLIIGGVTKKPISIEAFGVTGLARVDNSAVNAAAIAILAQATTSTTADNSDNTTALQTSATATVAAGATNDKAASGSVNTITRGDGTDDGILDAINGSTSLMFHNSGAAGITNKAYGYSSILISQQGTITDLYDFYAERAPAGGTVTNHYGVYVKSDSATPVQHWLGDKTLIGGTSFSAPTVELDVQGDARIRNFAASGVVTNDVNGNLITVPAGTPGNVLTDNGTDWVSSPAAGATLPTVQKFTSPGNQTYTTPANVRYLKVFAVGGGGGGGGGGAAGAGNGGNGGTTLFSVGGGGANIISAGGGTGGISGNTSGGPGGVAALTGFLGNTSDGGDGSAPYYGSVATNGGIGGIGGSSALGGGGSAGYLSGAATNGKNQTGGGGGGGGTGATPGAVGGAGGGAGAYVEVIITSPGASYDIDLAGGGGAGSTGSGGSAAGIGGDGVLIVEEYY